MKPSVLYDNGLKERLKDPEYAFRLVATLAKEAEVAEARLREVDLDCGDQIRTLTEQLAKQTERVRQAEAEVIELRRQIGNHTCDPSVFATLPVVEENAQLKERVRELNEFVKESECECAYANPETGLMHPEMCWRCQVLLSEEARQVSYTCTHGEPEDDCAKCGTKSQPDAQPPKDTSFWGMLSDYGKQKEYERVLKENIRLKGAVRDLQEDTRTQSNYAPGFDEWYHNRYHMRSIDAGGLQIRHTAYEMMDAWCSGLAQAQQEQQISASAEPATGSGLRGDQDEPKSTGEESCEAKVGGPVASTSVQETELCASVKSALRYEVENPFTLAGFNNHEVGLIQSAYRNAFIAGWNEALKQTAQDGDAK